MPDAIRIYLWWASVAIALLLPLYIFNIGRNNPTAQRELDKVLVVSPSMVERFGLFTIIVLGEVVVWVISGLSEHQQLTLEIGAIATATVGLFQLSAVVTLGVVVVLLLAPIFFALQVWLERLVE